MIAIAIIVYILLSVYTSMLFGRAARLGGED